jgi:hypothetical protein
MNAFVFYNKSITSQKFDPSILELLGESSAKALCVSIIYSFGKKDNVNKQAAVGNSHSFRGIFTVNPFYIKIESAIHFADVLTASKDYREFQHFFVQRPGLIIGNIRTHIFAYTGQQFVWVFGAIVLIGIPCDTEVHFAAKLREFGSVTWEVTFSPDNVDYFFYIHSVRLININNRRC